MCASERWENLSELGHLSQMHPRTLGDSPRGTQPGSRWGSVSGVRSCELLPVSPKVRTHSRVAVLSLSLYFKKHFTPPQGSKCSLASAWCTHCVWVIEYNRYRTICRKIHCMWPQIKTSKKMYFNNTSFILLCTHVQTSPTERSCNW